MSKSRKARSLRFEYWQSTDKQWYWHLKSGREIIAQGEGYKRISSVTRIWKLLAGNPTVGIYPLPKAPQVERRVVIVETILSAEIQSRNVPASLGIG